MTKSLISKYHGGMTAHTEYLSDVFVKENFSETMRRTTHLARMMRRAYKFDTIVFTGMSGAAVAFPLSLALNTSLVCIRKVNDNSHYPFSFEGNANVKDYIIVDDFISIGTTIRNVLSKMAKAKPKATCKAILLYKSRRHKLFSYKGNAINVHCSDQFWMEQDSTPCELLRFQRKNPPTLSDRYYS
ncbi:Phosphoribosyltransferase domain [uncultured Caudovirales phage]|uniref:Phosphoribosyltransferase domain n=1 Tax=uncultured Caudovirales phage TaxID=2100421 RepID=A0A6J5RQV9_9CAUD|nr:Phosphoribosyltransferase domain [uncultured Caudovirales phage]